jgi:outer membrane protein assembly factor BamE
MIRRHYVRPAPATPDDMTPISAHRRAVFATAALLLTLAALGGCVYRPNIQQGNFLEVKDVDQVTTGMTRSQVRYLLGTPMISDPFEAQRWDYVYTLKRGRSRKIDRAHFVVYFAEDTVTRVDKLDLPEATSVSGGKKMSRKERKQASREPPPAPSVSAPQPDAPRPGDIDR